MAVRSHIPFHTNLGNVNAKFTPPPNFTHVPPNYIAPQQTQIYSQLPNPLPPTLVQIPLLNENVYSNYPQTQVLTQQTLSPLGFDVGSFTNLQLLLQQQATQQQPVPQQPQALLQPQPILNPKPEPFANTVHNEPKDRRPSHHDLLRQHNEEYKLKQMKKTAIHMANTRYGLYAPQDSTYFNFIVPVLPNFSEETK